MPVARSDRVSAADNRGRRYAQDLNAARTTKRSRRDGRETGNACEQEPSASMLTDDDCRSPPDECVVENSLRSQAGKGAVNGKSVRAIKAPATNLTSHTTQTPPSCRTFLLRELST
jgi:hypothetical protein